VIDTKGVVFEVSDGTLVLVTVPVEMVVSVLVNDGEAGDVGDNEGSTNQLLMSGICTLQLVRIAPIKIKNIMGRIYLIFPMIELM
jgi:hypothetical protein